MYFFAKKKNISIIVSKWFSQLEADRNARLVFFVLLCWVF